MEKENQPVVQLTTSKKTTPPTKKGGGKTEVIINPVEKQSGVVNERFLDVVQRMKRGQQIRRRESIMKLKKQIAQLRPHTKKQLRNHASQIAKSAVRGRFAGQRGREYAKLSVGDRVQVDRNIENKSKIVRSIAARILPRLHAADTARLADKRGHGKVKGLSKYLTTLVQSNELEMVSDIYDTITEKDIKALHSKAEKSGVDFTTIKEIFARGLSESTIQRAFERVNSFLANGKARSLDRDVLEAKKMKGKDPCWDNYKMVGTEPNGDPKCVGPIKEQLIDINEKFKTAAWSRREGKNPEGGLNKKGIASYRRQNPGSKLSMAVTTSPSKLDPDSKSAKRRKSFCARMSGVDGPMKKPSGEPTRKALALRKWNC